MRDESDEHEDAEHGRVPSLRAREPGVGQHRDRDTEQFELGVHAGFAAVHGFERAHRHERGRDQPEPALVPHPPREQRDCARAKGSADGARNQNSLTPARASGARSR